MKKITIQDMVLCAMFVVLIAVGAFIKIPIPVVPFTLQFLFTLMAGILLGGPLGALSVALYVVLGLAGLPIFAEGGGLGYVFQPSFGYLIGFIIGTFVTGIIVNAKSKPSIKRLLMGNFIGLIIVYLCGMVYYYFMKNLILGEPIGLWSIFLYCFLLAVPGDIVICVGSAFLGQRLIPIKRRIIDQSQWKKTNNKTYKAN